MSPRRARWRAAAALLGALVVPMGAAGAADGPSGRDLRGGSVRAGALFVKASRTSLQARDAGSPLALAVDFDRDLGLDSHQTVPRLAIWYRFGRRHALQASWFEIDRSGLRLVEDEFDFGDITVPVDSEVSSFVDLEVFKLAYNNIFFTHPRVDLSFSAGVNFTRVGAGIAYDETTFQFSGEEEVDADLPLPVLGFRLVYRLGGRWRVITASDVFALEYADYRGSLTEFEFSVEHRTFRSLGFGVGLTRLAYDIESDEGDYDLIYGDIMTGINAYLVGYF